MSKNQKLKKKILFQLKEKAKLNILKLFPDFITSSCFQHYDYILNLLYRTKIYKECKWVYSNLRRKNPTKNVQKLRILQNK